MKRLYRNFVYDNNICMSIYVYKKFEKKMSSLHTYYFPGKRKNKARILCFFGNCFVI